MPRRLEPHEWPVLIVGLAGGFLPSGTVLQKLTFLMVMEHGLCCLDFRPSPVGPVSEELAEGVRMAERNNLLVVEGRDCGFKLFTFRLTGEGWRLYHKLESELDGVERLKAVVCRWSMSPLGLLRYVYLKYRHFLQGSL